MKNQSFKSRLNFAFSGILSAARTESSFKFQLIAAIGAICLLVLLRAAPIWWAVFTLVIGAVLSSELFNTALEHLIDHLHPEQHPSIKLAKDCAAGAVLVFSLTAVIVFVCFLYERFG